MNKKINSCGAILYSYDENGNMGFILGKEEICDGGKLKWYPFKGCSDKNETLEQTAIREVFEETGGLVKIEKIDLYLAFTTPKKQYYIGLHYAPYSIVEKYNNMNKDILNDAFKEKKEIKFFLYSEIKKEKDLADMTKKMLNFFKDEIKDIPKKRVLSSIKIIPKAPLAPWAKK